MLPNVSDLSDQDDQNAAQPELIIPSSNSESRSIEIDQGFPDNEKAENEIWQGIKSEKADNLELAAFYYRSAIEHDPECDKAYRLLSHVLKKIRETKGDRQVLVKSPQDEKTETVNLPTSLHISTDKLENMNGENKVKSKSDMVLEQKEDILPSNKNSLSESSKEKSHNANTVPIDVHDSDSSPQQKQPKSEIVLLPSMEMAPSGDMVLQDNLTVSQLYVEQALAFYEQKDLDKSIAACKQALKTCPSLAKAYKVWGNCLQQAGNSADAIGIYAKALELQPNMPEIYCNLGSIYAKSKKWQQAIEYYQKSIVIDPNCVAAYRNLARVWDELKEYDKSEEYFFQALAIKPELISARNHFDLAHNLAEENKRDQAIACYKSCIKLEPTFLNAYVRLAQLLEQEGKADEALFYYKKLAELQTGIKADKNQPKSRRQIHQFLFGKKNQKTSPKSAKTPVIKRGKKKKALPQLKENKRKALPPQEKIAVSPQKAKKKSDSESVQFELGNRHFREGQLQEAISCYLNAIKLNPRQAKYYLVLGKAWEKLGDSIKANQCFYQAFSLEPEKVKGKNHLLLGDKLLEQRQINMAIACYRRAITQNPKIVKSYWQLGRILLSGGNSQGAIACYQQAVKVEPKNPLNYLYLGNALAQTQQTAAAISCYGKAAEINPENADIQHNLGEVLFQGENWQESAAAYRQAIALNPNNSWSYNNLGDALMKLEQWQEAADSLRRAIKLKPDFVWSHYNLGEALSKLEQWDEALEEYKLAQQLDPNLPLVRQKIGGILHKRSKSSQHEAASFCEAQIKEDPDNIELYHQAIALNRRNHELYLGLGKALAKQHKMDEAISIFQMGLEIKPDDLELSSELNKVIQVRY